MINDFDFMTTCDISGFLKEEIRSILIYKSAVKDTDIVLDINCGVGEISTELSNMAEKVYAIDESQQAITISQENIKKLGNIDKVELINENELSALEKIEEFDVTILKAKKDNYNEIIEKVHEKINSKGRILILTNLLDYEVDIVKKLDELNYIPQITQINISKGQLLYKGIKLESQNPMTIVYAKKR
ncbi:methyltransferase domain-containing protein [Methanobrevibacter sp.]|uniref:methyltransferase domain-containing protein n=1 Tax=Methanobrevibacter sp. TaxID=66852 RepID=UPI0025CCC30C|nr:methyltransferase domain-containing protein [Methanobrevibacter sp.]MBQ2961329.1 methyltransferase domain-containing protein [Methanobrevibacter sp.]